MFTKAIVAAVQAAVLPLQKEISCLKDELAKLKSELDEVKAKANNNKQYSRRNSIRIFGQNEEEGEDCYAKVVDLCENVLEIEVGRNELDRVHRVSWSYFLGDFNIFVQIMSAGVSLDPITDSV